MPGEDEIALDGEIHQKQDGLDQDFSGKDSDRRNGREKADSSVRYQRVRGHQRQIAGQQNAMLFVGEEHSSADGPVVEKERHDAAGGLRERDAAERAINQKEGEVID